jgi:hypothetical protein
MINIIPMCVRKLSYLTLLNGIADNRVRGVMYDGCQQSKFNKRDINLRKSSLPAFGPVEEIVPNDNPWNKSCSLYVLSHQNFAGAREGKETYDRYFSKTSAPPASVTSLPSFSCSSSQAK